MRWALMGTNVRKNNTINENKAKNKNKKNNAKTNKKDGKNKKERAFLEAAGGGGGGGGGGFGGGTVARAAGGFDKVEDFRIVREGDLSKAPRSTMSHREQKEQRIAG